MTLRFGLIGFGAIGKSIAEAVRSGAAGDARIVSVLVRDAAKHARDADGHPYPFTSDPESFFAEEMDLVVEAAGHQALREYAVRSLSTGHDFLTISVGAFADTALLDTVVEAARSAGRRVLIPSGAIGGLDAVTAGAIGGLDEVTITTRKPPEAWKGTVAEGQMDLAAVSEPICIYEGPAREAARLYPQNVNVQASLALAGIGMDRTRSRIFVDPTVRYNTHEITARGSFGEVRVTISNVPTEGAAKTGKITAMSMVKAIRNLTAPLVLGL